MNFQQQEQENFVFGIRYLQVKHQIAVFLLFYAASNGLGGSA